MAALEAIAEEEDRLRIGCPRSGETIADRETLFRRLAALAHHALGEGARGFDEGDLVHQRERLQRRVRARAFWGAGLAIGRVEEQHRRRRSGAFPDRVKGAAKEPLACVGFVIAEVAVDAGLVPDPRWHVRTHARAAHLRGHQAGHGEGLIADEFPAEAEARTAREEPVLGIALDQFRRDRGTLPVGIAHDEKFDHRLHVPGLRRLSVYRWKNGRGDKFHREPVEQLGVHRPLGLRAEVFGGLDDADAEEALPLAVDPDPRGERMIARDEPLREAETILRRTRRERRQCGGEMATHFVGGAVVFTAFEDKGLPSLGPFLHHHHTRQRLLIIDPLLFRGGKGGGGPLHGMIGIGAEPGIEGLFIGLAPGYRVARDDRGEIRG